MKRVISVLALVCLLASMCGLSAFAEEHITKQSDFESAMKAAAAGATLVLGDGPFDMVEPVTAVTLQGNGSTVINFPGGEQYGDMVTYVGIKGIAAPSDKGNGGEQKQFKLTKGGAKSVYSGTWGGIDWTFENNTLTISPTTGSPVADKNCGKTYEVGVWRENVTYNDSGTATAVGGRPYEDYKEQVYTLIIKEGVTHIGAWVAKEFTNLTGEVIIPSTVNYIGQEAFQKSSMTKLTFAKGGSEELCIAQGALKNLIVEEIILPSDRPVHIHAWQFLNSANLKHVTFPATLTSVTGTHHHDWQSNPNATNSGNLNTSTVINSTNKALESISFGNEDVRNMVFNKDNSYIANFGGSRIGLTYYKNVEAAAKYAEAGDTITLLKDTDEEIALPPGVLLDKNGFTADNITVTPLPTSTNAPVSDVPATGDMSNMPLWALLFVAFTAVAVMTRKKKA